MASKVTTTRERERVVEKNWSRVLLHFLLWLKMKSNSIMNIIFHISCLIGVSLAFQPWFQCTLRRPGTTAVKSTDFRKEQGKNNNRRVKYNNFQIVQKFEGNLTDCFRKNDVKGVDSIIAEMQAAGVACRPQTFTKLISGFGRLRLIDKAKQMFDSMIDSGVERNVIHYNAMIDAYAKRGQYMEAIAILSLMQQDQVKPDVTTYNTLITACGKCRKWYKALQLFDEMAVEGIARDTVTFNAAITACEKSGRWERALLLFEQMAVEGIGRNTITFNTAITACEKGFQWEKALELFERMAVEGVNRNTITFSTAITACEKGLQWESAIKLFERMASEGVARDTITFNTAITACEKCGQWEKVLTLFERMALEGVARDTITFNTAITACETGRQWRSALRLFDQMSAERLPRTNLTFNAVIENLVHVEDPVEVNALTVGVVSQGLKEGVWSKLVTVDKHQFQTKLGLVLVKVERFSRVVCKAVLKHLLTSVQGRQILSDAALALGQGSVDGGREEGNDVQSGPGDGNGDKGAKMASDDAANDEGGRGGGGEMERVLVIMGGAQLLTEDGRRAVLLEDVIEILRDGLGLQVEMVEENNAYVVVTLPPL